MTDKNLIRIIGGKYKSRKINILPNSNIRPTPDRIRETLFNWLMHDITHAHVLDLFGGSGAITIEALSRGAEFILCNDINPKVIQHLEKIIANITNITSPEAKQIKLSNQNAITLLEQPNHSHQQYFDIVILDPPFNQNLLKPCLENLINNNWLNFNKPNSNPLIYFETEESLVINNLIEEMNNINLNKYYLEIIKHKLTNHISYGLFTVNQLDQYK